jgi:hypothetical protein
LHQFANEDAGPRRPAQDLPRVHRVVTGQIMSDVGLMTVSGGSAAFVANDRHVYVIGELSRQIPVESSRVGLPERLPRPSRGAVPCGDVPYIRATRLEPPSGPSAAETFRGSEEGCVGAPRPVRLLLTPTCLYAIYQHANVWRASVWVWPRAQCSWRYVRSIAFDELGATDDFTLMLRPGVPDVGLHPDREQVLEVRTAMNSVVVDTTTDVRGVEAPYVTTTDVRDVEAPYVTPEPQDLRFQVVLADESGKQMAELTLHTSARGPTSRRARSRRARANRSDATVPNVGPPPARQTQVDGVVHRGPSEDHRAPSRVCRPQGPQCRTGQTAYLTASSWSMSPTAPGDTR